MKIRLAHGLVTGLLFSGHFETHMPDAIYESSSMADSILCKTFSLTAALAAPNNTEAKLTCLYLTKFKILNVLV